MTEYHSRRTFLSDRKTVPYRSGARQTVQPMLISEDLLQIILISFVDCGLTPQEMSKASNLPLEVILDGLAKRS